MTEVRCPHCQAPNPVDEVYTGQRLRCAQCAAIIVLEVAPTTAAEPRATPPTAPAARRPRPPETVEARAQRILGSWLDLEAKDVVDALARIAAGTAYRQWQVPKPNGTTRTITAPDDGLKGVQRRILDRFLYRIPISNAAHGFVTSRSIVTNARAHLETAQELLNYDLKDAFPSVLRDRVRHLFVRHVKIPLKHLGETADQAVAGRIVDMLVELTTYAGSLPQGAPTSGCLLNIACIKLDKYLLKFLGEFDHALRYTRYADDLTISGPDAIPSEVHQQVQKIVRHCGYTLNPEKMRHLSVARGQRLEVTGLILDKGQLRIPRDRLDAYRAAIYQASKLDVLPEETQLEIQSTVAFVKMVYRRLPSRIAIPYTAFLQKHGLRAAGTGPRMGLDLYPDGQKPPALGSDPPGTPLSAEE